MKVLIAFPNNITQSNPFVKILYYGLRQAGCDVTWDLDEFWNNPSKYDIIHIHWPDSLFKAWAPNAQDIERLEDHIALIKNQSKIVYTRHNECPHFTSNEYKSKSYSVIEQNADAIVHLGDADLDTFKKKLRKYRTFHFIIPHHIYEGEYNLNISKLDARNKLGIPQDSFSILAFGAFRDTKEVSLLLSAFDLTKVAKKYLIAPRMQTNDLNFFYPRKSKFDWLRFKRVPKNIEYNRIHFGKQFTTDEMVPLYFIASDVIVIQRTNSLNSGNIPLAFLFKKAVIGPDIGNMGELLKKTNNILFDPKNPNSLPAAINLASELPLDRIGNENFELAERDFNVSLTAIKYIEVYKILL